MRILEIRFTNLNALAGSWQINLTHPAYTGEGLFAITGPTGAGKSTILDALCLALYGRTPRLERINHKENEILSRRTGFCLAEVLFTTQSGRFRSHWSQQRARKRPDGKLQPQYREITNADTGQILAHGPKETAEYIETITGMDFHRFTRSMLLAQGGFAAFLLADADARSPILEQITGTEIYSRISIRVHELCSQQRHALQTLEAEMGGITPWDEQTESTCRHNLEHWTLRLNDLQRQTEPCQQALAWLNGLEKLEEEQAQRAAKEQEWQQRQSAFDQDRERLRQAVLALELAGEYAELTTLRREQAENHHRRQTCLTTQPHREQEAARTREKARQTEEQRDRLQAARDVAAPLLRQTRELDLRLREMEKLTQGTTQELTAREAEGRDQEARLQAATTTLRTEHQALDHVTRTLAHNHNDASLVEQLAGIRQRLEGLKQRHAHQTALEHEVTAATTRLTAAHLHELQQNQRRDALKQALDAERTTLEGQQRQLREQLQGRELPLWRQQAAGLQRELDRLQRVETAAATATSEQRRLEALEARLTTLTATLADTAVHLTAQRQELAALEREQGLLETQLALIRTIQGFTETRQELRDGEPCPLCGALEHPFAAGNIPAPGAARAELERVRTALKRAQTQVAQLQVRQAEAAKEREQTQARAGECAQRIADAWSLVRQEGWEREAAARDLSETRLEVERGLALAGETVTAAETLEREIARHREGTDQLREALGAAETLARQAAHQRESARQELDREQREAAEGAERVRAEQAEAQREAAPYALPPLLPETLDDALAALTRRRDQWLAWQREKEARERAVRDLEHRIRMTRALLEQGEGERAAVRQRLARQREEMATLARQRRELFGDRNPDLEERRLAGEIEATERALSDHQREAHAAAGEVARLQGEVAQLTEAMTRRVALLEAREQGLAARLEALGFAGEAPFLVASLPEMERRGLDRQARALDGEQAELAARRVDLEERLAAERARGLTEHSREAVAEELARLTAGQVEAQQEIGAARRQLADNELIKQRQRQRLEEIAAQRQECARWAALDQLIGSSDGKKYRNFAQGLTFERVIAHANQALGQMSDRYVLVRDRDHPLELNVIDRDQAGEVRSTRNLSGGESFIVSLALALGLSQLASQRTRVDSLFLDEGFGTLDEEALETALATLAGLRREGKLIGVISHVPALKERIPIQIRVIPGPGGRSRLSGPGCAPGAGSP